MLILDRNAGAGQLLEVFREVDGELVALERKIAAGETLPLAPTLDDAIMLVKACRHNRSVRCETQGAVTR